MRTLITLALALVALLSGVTANADDDPPPSLPGMPCTVGQVDVSSATTRYISALTIEVRVPGSLDCGGYSPESTAKWALVAFNSDTSTPGFVAEQGLRDFGPVAPTVFTDGVADLQTGWGACLMSSSKTKLSCFRIAATTGTSVSVTQVATSDPFFRRRVEVVYNVPKTPECPSCW